MGVGSGTSPFVGAGITRSYSKLWPALPRRHGASSGPSTSPNHDVPPARCRRSSDVIRDSQPGAFFKPPFPNPKLFFAIIATQIVAMLMCSEGWLVPSISWGIIGFVWAYNLAWMLVQDVV